MKISQTAISINIGPQLTNRSIQYCFCVGDVLAGVLDLGRNDANAARCVGVHGFVRFITHAKCHLFRRLNDEPIHGPRDDIDQRAFGVVVLDLGHELAKTRVRRILERPKRRDDASSFLQRITDRRRRHRQLGDRFVGIGHISACESRRGHARQHQANDNALALHIFSFKRVKNGVSAVCSRRRAAMLVERLRGDRPLRAVRCRSHAQTSAVGAAIATPRRRAKIFRTA